MNLKNFEEQISPIIFERGEQYYMEDAVLELDYLDEGDYSALVRGRDIYDVDVSFDENNNIFDLFCTCPFEGDVCKHMVAVLLKIRDEECLTKKIRDTAKEIPGWKELIKNAPEEDLREFITEYAKENREFRNRLELKFSENNENISVEKYDQILGQAFLLAEGEYGFIDYHHTSTLMKVVNEFQEKANSFIDKTMYKQGFLVLTYIVTNCIQSYREIDDSDGECSAAIEQALISIFELGTEISDEDLKDEIFNWLLEQLVDSEYEEFGFAGILETALIDLANSSQKIKIVHEFLDNQLKMVKNEEYEWEKDRKTEKYLLFKIELYENEGKNNEAQKLISENMEYEEIRKLEILRNEVEGNKEKVIQLIKGGIKVAKDKDLAGVVNNWKKMLLDIYSKNDDVEMVRKYSVDLFFSNHYNLDFYKIAKSTYKDEEWMVKRDELISKMIKNEKIGNKISDFSFSYIANVFIEEKLFDRLFEIVVEYGSIEELIQYTEYLSQDYSDQLLEIYRKTIIRYSEEITGRKKYQKLAGYINKMTELKGGKKQAKDIVKTLLEKYQKRPALKEELNRLNL